MYVYLEIMHLYSYHSGKRKGGGQIVRLLLCGKGQSARHGLCGAVCVVVMTLVCSGCYPISISCHTDELRHLFGDTGVSVTGCP